MSHIYNNYDDAFIYDVSNNSVAPTLHRHKPVLFEVRAFPRCRGLSKLESSRRNLTTPSLLRLSSFLKDFAARGENLIFQSTLILQLLQRRRLYLASANLGSFFFQQIHILKLVKVCTERLTELK